MERIASPSRLEGRIDNPSYGKSWNGWPIRPVWKDGLAIRPTETALRRELIISRASVANERLVVGGLHRLG